MSKKNKVQVLDPEDITEEMTDQAMADAILGDPDLETTKMLELAGEEAVDRSISAKAVAAKCGVNAKTFRRFLREYFKEIGRATPGQGGTYAFSSDEAVALTTAFSKWSSPKKSTDDTEELDTEGAADLKAKIEASIAEVLDGDEDFDLDLEAIDGPSDDELETEDDEDEDEDGDTDDSDDVTDEISD